jgi:hypothetical protein
MKKYLGAGSLLMSSLALVLIGAGCVSTVLPVPSNHPARVDAPSGRIESEPAAILNPEASLYPSEALAAPAEVENRGNGQVLSPDGSRESPFVGRGVIQSIEEGQLVIQHGAIPEFMGAMTMAFQVSEDAMNDSLEVGDEIIFKIEAHPEHGYQIFSVNAIAAESDQAPANEPGHQPMAPGPTGSQTSPTSQP